MFQCQDPFHLSGFVFPFIFITLTTSSRANHVTKTLDLFITRIKKLFSKKKMRHTKIHHQ